jgi:hypothetical protein
MRAWTAVGGWSVGAGSVVLIDGGMALACANRQLVPASLTGWAVSNISGSGMTQT